jgi:hypothetical protein
MFVNLPASRRIIRGLQHAEFVAVWIGQDMPAPSVLDDGLPG